MKTLSILLFSVSLTLGFAMYRSSQLDRLPDPNNILYPNVDSTYLVKILRPGEFNPSYINYDANTMEWYVLVNNGVTYFIKQAKEIVSKGEGDDEGKLVVRGPDSLNSILFMSGVEMVPKEVEEMKLGRKDLGPGDRLEIEYLKKRYVISVEGTEAKERTQQGQAATIVIKDYKIYIGEGTKEKNKTLLIHLNKLGDFKPKIVFMGDMDNDKKPDLIMQAQDQFGKNYFTLFLSNHPKKGSMYKLESVFGYRD